MATDPDLAERRDPRWWYYSVPRDYGLSNRLDERVFCSELLRLTGRSIAPGELNAEATDLVLHVADWVANDAPPPPAGASPSGMPKAVQAFDDWFARVQAMSVEKWVEPRTAEEAFRALRGLRPDLRGRPGGLKRYKPVARAALARCVADLTADLFDHRARILRADPRDSLLTRATNGDPDA